MRLTWFDGHNIVDQEGGSVNVWAFLVAGEPERPCVFGLHGAGSGTDVGHVVRVLVAGVSMTSLTHHVRILCVLVLLLLLTAHCRRIAVRGEGSLDASADASVPEVLGPVPTLRPTVLLISLDGFRWDYSTKVETPYLDQMRASGGQAAALVPVFPSKTFPNHYSIVTGLYPEKHGIVSNGMFDPVFGARFSMTDDRAVKESRWWGGEPIWVTAGLQGQRSATMYWPGSEAAIKDTRPTYAQPFAIQISHKARIDQLIEWLTLPDDKRPTLLTLYLSDVDGAGHDYGPDSFQVEEAVQRVDNTLGLLLQALEARGLRKQVNILVTSDHGMGALDPKKQIYLEDYIDINDVYINDFGSVLGLNPKPGKLELVYGQLKGKHPHLQIYKRDEVPARLHYRAHRRIPDIVGVVSPGWLMARNRDIPLAYAGTHGYDPASPDMHGIFVASGPAFRKGGKIPAVENIHIYALMCHILGLTPATNDGDLAKTRPLLK